jgi:hypothetical protein
MEASTLRVTGGAPSSASASCKAGTIAADTSFIYVCTTDNAWKRVPLTRW